MHFPVIHRLTGGLRFGLKPHPPAVDVVDRRNDTRSLLRYALATASICGIGGCGPSGPAPTFASASLLNTRAVRQHTPRPSEGEKKDESL
jgi:hypothetical protein